jgi:HEAT repeat protein
MFFGRQGSCFLVAAIVVALISGCQKHVDPDEELITQLKDADPRQRATATVIISEMRPVPEKFIKPLIEALHDGDPQVRLAAAQALAETGVAGRPYANEIIKIANEHFDAQTRIALERAIHRINADQ